MKCKHHGPATQGVWACPTCLVELRDENKRLTERASDILAAVEQILDAGHMNQEDLARLRAAYEKT